MANCRRNLQVKLQRGNLTPLRLLFTSMILFFLFKQDLLLYFTLYALNVDEICEFNTFVYIHVHLFNSILLILFHTHLLTFVFIILFKIKVKELTLSYKTYFFDKYVQCSRLMRFQFVGHSVSQSRV